MPAKKVVKKTTKKAVTKKTTKKTVVKKNVVKKKKINTSEYYDLIAKEAYFLFEKGGYTHGNDQENWFEAEKRIKKEWGL